MKLSIRELTTLIECIERTPFRPLRADVLKKRIVANRKKKMKKYANETLRS